MTGRLDNFLNRSPVLSVLILSGLVGFCLGLSNATWQCSVETGQVLAGIVKYPIDNPFYMYHIKAFAITNHFSALLLYLVGSEKLVSIIISGLLGMISFQALGMFIFAINRNIYMSVLGAIFIYFMNYTGKGVLYPIDLLGKEGTCGVLGPSFIVLVIALIGAKSYRLGLFCLGLAPCVHPTLGAWLLLIISLSAFFQLDFAKKIIREYYWYFIAGILSTISILIYQLYLMQDLPVVAPEIKKQYLDSFVKYWSYHRKKFYWDFSAPNIHFKRWGILFCIYSVIAGFLSLKYFKKNSPLSFLSRVVIISGILSLSLGFITQLPPEKIPSYLLISMPGRYVNLNNIVLGAFLLGLLTYCDNKPFITNYNVFIFLLISSFFSRHVELHTASFAVILSWLAYLTLKKDYSAKKEASLSIRNHKVGYEKLLLIFLAVFWLINLPREKFVNHYLVNPDNFEDRTNNEFYLKISERNGVMVTMRGEDLFMISLKTRRPILVDMSAMNFFPYALESAIVLDNILKKVYGVDLLTPPPKNCQHNEIPSDLYRDLWEKRTVEEWRDIKKEFGVTDVLTKADWKLLLPVIGKNEKMVLYEIPDEKL